MIELHEILLLFIAFRAFANEFFVRSGRCVPIQNKTPCRYNFRNLEWQCTGAVDKAQRDVLVAFHIQSSCEIYILDPETI